jgi:hypothetical protein
MATPTSSLLAYADALLGRLREKERPPMAIEGPTKAALLDLGGLVEAILDLATPKKLGLRIMEVKGAWYAYAGDGEYTACGPTKVRALERLLDELTAPDGE